MGDAISKEYRALLEEASEMFDETGCVSGIDGEEAPAERIVPDAKEYIAETIDNPEATYDPKIWDAPGFTLVLPGWRKNGANDARGSHLAAVRTLRST